MVSKFIHNYFVYTIPKDTTTYISISNDVFSIFAILFP